MSDDGSQVGPLLEQIAGPVASFTGDGAYDRDDVYREVLPASSGCGSHCAATLERGCQAQRQTTAPTKRDRHLQLIAERGSHGAGSEHLVTIGVPWWRPISAATRRVDRLTRCVSRTEGRQTTEG